jgi:hypothetical protein
MAVKGLDRLEKFDKFQPFCFVSPARPRPPMPFHDPTPIPIVPLTPGGKRPAQREMFPKPLDDRRTMWQWSLSKCFVERLIRPFKAVGALIARFGSRRRLLIPISHRTFDSP